MLGLGKKRSKFGKWVDRNDIKQIDLEKAAGLSRGKISKLCNDKRYKPKYPTIHKIKKALSDMGKNIREDDFWNM